MPTNRTNEMMVYCSFCGKSQEEVQRLSQEIMPLFVMNVWN